MGRSVAGRMTLQINPDIEIKASPIEGKGLFTRVPIRKGEHIWIAKGEEPYYEKVYTDQEFEAFVSWCIEHGKEWDAVSNGDGTHTAAIAERDKHPSNYGNHSCEPTLSKDHVALRDIQPGEELTVDYMQFSDKGWSMQCCCGAVSCKGIVRGVL